MESQKREMDRYLAPLPIYISLIYTTVSALVTRKIFLAYEEEEWYYKIYQIENAIKNRIKKKHNLEYHTFNL